MSMTLEKPIPYATPISEPFWQALREKQIRIQHCAACDAWIFYPRSHCPGCLSRELTWKTASGGAQLHTFTISRIPTVPMFKDEVPQFIAVVELDEGVRLTSTLVDAEEDQIAVGMRLLPVFAEVEGGEGVLLRFRPA